MKISRNSAAVFILAAVVFISYANIFKNEFAWDDFYFITDNIHIREFGSIPSFFTEPSTGDLYRPLRGIFYALTYKMWGLDAFGYHLSSLLAHLAVTLLVYFITLKITEKNSLSFIASLFFAAHPVHTERITNMTAAFDAYGIVFLLLAFFFYAIFSKNKLKKYFVFSNVFYFLALFSSEEAITLIPILFLYEFSFNHNINLANIKLLLKRYAPFIAITLFYLLIRFMVVGKAGRAEIYFNESFFGALLTTVKIFFQYILILFFPAGLVTERYVKFEASIFSFAFLVSLAALLLLFFFFVKSYKKSKIIFFSIGWFFITLLPFSNILPQYTIMAERYLYLPSYGFCLLLAFLILSIEKINFAKFRVTQEYSIKKYSKFAIIIIVLLVASSYTLLTIQRNAEWRDNFTLLSKTAERNPFGTRTYQALALHYRNQGDYDKAFSHALKAVELSSKNHHAYENLGTISTYTKNYQQAIYYYNKSLEIAPDYYLALNNLGLVYIYIGDFNNSFYYLNKAIKVDPKLAKAYNDLGVVYAQSGDFDAGIMHIREAIEINPYEADYYRNLAVIYSYLGNNAESESLMEKSMEIESAQKEIKERLGR
ncbi:MAG: tetratricopeptide repeat protein [Nanoarchaeota archaeon]